MLLQAVFLSRGSKVTVPTGLVMLLIQAVSEYRGYRNDLKHLKVSESARYYGLNTVVLLCIYW